MNGGFFRRYILRPTEIIQSRCTVFYSGTIAFQSFDVKFLAILVCMEYSIIISQVQLISSSVVLTFTETVFIKLPGQVI